MGEKLAALTNQTRGDRWVKAAAAAWLVAVCLALVGCRDPRPLTPARQLNAEQLLALPTPEHEHCYALIFSSQRPSHEPRYTHTWGTAVRTIELPGQPRRIIAVDTISWMPATLEIVPGRLTPEKGVNLGLDATIQEMLKQQERVSLWGPYEIWRGLYLRFIEQKGFIESGRIGYQCIDQIGGAARNANASNCFHAITDMDPQFGRGEYPLIRYGDDASENIVRQLFRRPLLINPRHTHDWLIKALGLDRYPITFRRYSGPAREFSPEAMRAEAEAYMPASQPASAPASANSK
ncbi:MAG: hypothetical protein ABFD92_18295 [Planctomycetaceae bacterium]|nr:hypothetical protein [Planctomycetaceae bacterium]